MISAATAPPEPVVHRDAPGYAARMARTARSRGISMTPEVAALWDRLRGGRRPAAFLRDLLQHEQARLQEEQGRAALRWLQETRASLPPSWYDPELARVGDDEDEDLRNHPLPPIGTRITLSDGVEHEVLPWRWR